MMMMMMVMIGKSIIKLYMEDKSELQSPILKHYEFIKFCRILLFWCPYLF
jgi:hypothetical protein